MQRPALFCVILCAALIGARPATGQITPTGENPPLTLHEYIPDEKDLQQLIDFARRAGPGKLPKAFKADGDVIRKPTDGLTPRPRERTISQMDRKTQRQRQAAPDRDTKHEGTLHYHAVFNPSVVPFKRVSSLDAVDPLFMLISRSPRYRTLGITPVRHAPDRTFFWGSVLLRPRRGQKLPIPSVAPDMEIHGYQTVPAGITVTFFKDGADNFAVSTTRARKTRLRFLVSAPNRYFTHSVAAGLTLADVPGPMRPAVPTAVSRVAARMHQRLEISRDLPLLTVLNRLVAHYRAFEEGPLPINTGNTYEDLTVSQRGVCRHRSYAFVISALAIGLPARYVTNEAHAFVEVWIPQMGWIRIDLGGAANELNVSGAKDRTVHRPTDDPFPKPPAYSQNYSRLNGPVTGLSPRQRRGPTPRTGHGARRRIDPGGTTATPTPGTAGPPGTPTPSQRTAVQLWVGTAKTTGMRGDALVVTGRLSIKGGAGLEGRSVELLLRKPGSKDLIILGETVSGVGGRFRLETTVPVASAVGVYRVVAYTAEDKTYHASWSE